MQLSDPRSLLNIFHVISMLCMGVCRISTDFIRFMKKISNITNFSRILGRDGTVNGEPGVCLRQIDTAVTRAADWMRKKSVSL